MLLDYSAGQNEDERMEGRRRARKFARSIPGVLAEERILKNYKTTNG
jgi:hypothetical protein